MEKYNIPEESKEKKESLEIFDFKDSDGDECFGVYIDDYIVFATKDINSWSINFALKSDDINKGDWMDALTGKGAFTTMRELRPAFDSIIKKVESIGGQWIVNTDERRANLYQRYVPKDKIRITK